MSRIFFRFCAAALLIGAPAIHAATIVGRVLDASSGTYLSGATVEVVETGLTTAADSEGRFRFSDVPAGSYTLRGNFIGYETATSKVSLGATGESMVEIPLSSEIRRLEAFTVEGYREGRSKALQQKRTAENIMDIVSADAAGNLPDRTAAEAVSRVAGVSLSLTEGEGQYISIRGIEPNLNQVMIDGATMAAPGGSRTGRAVPLDVLTASQISQLEVIKTVTPDMDANSLGGTLNIKTTSGYDRKERFFNGSVSANRNDLADKTGYAANATYGDTFASGKYGAAVSANYDLRYYANDLVQSNSWAQATANGITTFLPTGFELHPEWGWRKRTGVTLNLEARPNAETQYYIRPNFTRGIRYQRREEIIYGVDTTRVTLTSPTAGTFDASRTRLERRELRSETDQDLFNLSTGMRKVIGGLTLEPMLTFSSAKQEVPLNQSLQFRGANGDPGPIQFDVSDFAFWKWQPGAGANDPSKFPLRTTRDDSGHIHENTDSAKLDARWDTDSLVFGKPGYLKTGGKITQRHRASNLPSSRVIPVGNWTLANVGVAPGHDAFGGQYATGFAIDWDKTWAFIRNNPALTVYDAANSLANSVEDNYKIHEDIYAAYAMGGLRFSKRASLLGGVRWERTDATIRGFEYRTFGSTFLGVIPQKGSKNYDEVLPNLQLNLRPTDKLVVRAAVTATMGRPAYEDARPYSTFTFQTLAANSVQNPAFPNSGSVTVGNPNVGPFRSLNSDLSIEYYTPHNGILSAAVFRKDIDHPIYQFRETQRFVTYNGVALDTLNVSSVNNADAASITGLELNLYQPFRFLPSPFDGFGVDANVTLIRSNVTIPLRPTDDLPFFRQPGRLENFTVFYQKGRFSGRVAFRSEDRQLWTLGSNLLSDIYRRARRQVDVQASFSLTNNFTLQGSVRNLTRTNEEFTYGKTLFLRTAQRLGRDYQLSANFKF